jgi:hypothetical protein
MLKQLKHIYNVMFFKYKLPFIYLKILFDILTSITRILIFPIIE